MTNEQINRAIAKAHLGKRYPEGYWVRNYCADLNAMHEAEKILNKDEFMLYCDLLWPLGHGVWEAIHTTAYQRAEAFLHTLGKWEGGQR